MSLATPDGAEPARRGPAPLLRTSTGRRTSQTALLDAGKPRWAEMRAAIWSVRPRRVDDLGVQSVVVVKRNARGVELKARSASLATKPIDGHPLS